MVSRTVIRDDSGISFVLIFRTVIQGTPFAPMQGMVSETVSGTVFAPIQ